MIDYVAQIKSKMLSAARRRLTLCAFGFHPYKWSPNFNIGRRANHANYQPAWLFQIGRCEGCGKAKRRWVGEARLLSDDGVKITWSSEVD